MLNPEGIIKNHKRRLQKLKEQQALYGSTIDPSIPLEIEDIETKIKEIEKQTKDSLREPERLFSMGTKALIEGHYWEAKRYYKMTLECDPFYPYAEEQLNKVKDILHSISTKSEGDNVRAKVNLKGVSLIGADMEGEYLIAANLEAANLEGANLKNVYLIAANLEDANLERANLVGANLMGADLEGANLKGANLEKSGLMGAYLVGANLDGANLKGVILYEAKYNDDTKWPDGFTPPPDAKKV